MHILVLKLSATQYLILPAGLLITENADGTATFTIGGNTIVVSPPFIGLVRRQLTTAFTPVSPPDPNAQWNGQRSNM